jgi:ABC-2 type transport system permease protein
MAWFQFFLRSLSSLRRSFMATLMMFVFPIVFFFIFGVLMQSGAQPGTTRIGVAESLAGHELARAFAKVDGVSVETLSPERGAEAFAKGDLTAFIVAGPNGPVARVPEAQQRYFRVLARAAHAASIPVGAKQVGSLRIETEPVRSSFVRYAMPGLFALALLQLMIYGTASPLLDERAKGTWRLFATLPISNISIMAGEALSRAVFAAVQMLILALLMAFYLDFETASGWWVMVPIFTLAIVMSITVGFALGGALPDERWGIHTLTFLNLFMLFFGHTFSPSGDGLGSYLAYVNPITYAADLVRWGLTGTEGILPAPVLAIALCLWTLLALAVGTFFFRFETATAR